MTIALTCPACNPLSDEEFLELVHDFHEADSEITSLGLNCGRTIMVAHMVNILGVLEQLNKDTRTGVEKYSFEDVIQKAKEMLPRLQALAKKHNN